eukprot:TRINITY_DN7639_c0_g1_i1.p1 TRINITY_DN7639_c0_g1~~TRINITY_DN7639_c0_g1_i1.p1  ORF type:complete len:1285 (+),score=251.78 TRINITY_DN7639_c0_g1_i1:18-3872(+)
MEDYSQKGGEEDFQETRDASAPLPTSSAQGAPQNARSNLHTSSSSSSSLFSTIHEEIQRKSRNAQTRHMVLETKRNEFFIVSSLCTRNDTQLISINPQCGSLFVETYLNEENAMSAIQSRKFQLKSKTDARALLGYFVFGHVAYLLVATKVRGDLQLFGGHIVNTIEEKLWVKIALNNVQSHPNKQEQKNIELLLDFPFEGLHFYCETFDITRPFPSPHVVADYDPEFCWNDWLAKSFEMIGMREWCVVLLQGMAISKTVPKYINVCLITRKSKANPGTRYFARGLNDAGGVGNEMECELMMWVGIDQNEINWCSFVWRRGTVPLWWRSELKSQVVRESEVAIREKPYDKAELYYTNLLDRFGHNPVVIFNMLRCGPKQDETHLSEHFQESLKHVKKFMSLDIKLFNFDWHHNLKQLGADHSIAGLWALLRSSIEDIDLNEGVITLHNTPDKSPSEVSLPSCPEGKYAMFQSIKKQKGVIRFNCADSLDRTNIATFFVAFQLAAEMGRRLGLNADLTNQENPASAPWSLFDLSLDQLTQVLKKNMLLECIAEFFVINGDVCSTLYTNSPAMHSALMRDYSPSISSAPLNAVIAIQRRYQNLYMDGARQSQYEMLLGLNKEKYFPGVITNAATNTISRPECVSRYPSWCLKSIPSLLSKQSTTDLLNDADNFVWVCPNEYDITEMYIYLSEPCYVTELALTIAHGISDETSPQFIDLFMGSYLDKMNVVFQNLAIPRCANGAQLYYNLPASMGKAYEGSGVYDFDVGSDLTNVSLLTRIVHIVFRGIPQNAHMTLGKVELFGFVSRTDSPSKARVKLRQMQAIQKVENIIKNDDQQVKFIENSSSDEAALRRSGSDLYGPESKSEESIPNGTLQYEEAIKKKNINQLLFLDALELEMIRLERGISPQERDTILLNLKLNIDSFNPDRFIFPRDEKAEISLRKSNKLVNKSNRCSTPDCDASLGLFSHKQCTYCYKKYCSNCMSSVPTKIIEFMWEKPQTVCKMCFAQLFKQDELLKKIKRLGEQIKFDRFKAKENQNYEMLLSVQHARSYKANLTLTTDTNISLAEYPTAGVLVSVPTKRDSPPIESILFPMEALALERYWCAPRQYSEMQISVVLSSDSIVHKLVLMVDSLGYSAADMPTINIMAGISMNQLKSIAVWDLPSLHTTVAPKQCLEFRFDETIRCRLLQLTISLPQKENKPNDCCLHLGRIQVIGSVAVPTVLSHSSPLNNATPAEKMSYEKALEAYPQRARSQIRPLWAQYRSGRKILDMCVEPVLISGFSVFVR